MKKKALHPDQVILELTKTVDFLAKKGERFIENNAANMLLERPNGGRAPWKIPAVV